MQATSQQLRDKLARAVELRDSALTLGDQQLVERYENVIVRLELLIARRQIFLDDKKRQS